jgi:hypothetical protein
MKLLAAANKILKKIKQCAWRENDLIRDQNNSENVSWDSGIKKNADRNSDY